MPNVAVALQELGTTVKSLQVELSTTLESRIGSLEIKVERVLTQLDDALGILKTLSASHASAIMPAHDCCSTPQLFSIASVNEEDDELDQCASGDEESPENDYVESNTQCDEHDGLARALFDKQHATGAQEPESLESFKHVNKQELSKGVAQDEAVPRQLTENSNTIEEVELSTDFDKGAVSGDGEVESVTAAFASEQALQDAKDFANGNNLIEPDQTSPRQLFGEGDGSVTSASFASAQVVQDAEDFVNGNNRLYDESPDTDEDSFERIEHDHKIMLAARKVAWDAMMERHRVLKEDLEKRRL